MRNFFLDRLIDDSKISGTGAVAQGTEYDDGICTLHWIVGSVRSTTIFNSIEEIKSIHGHGGHTVLKFIGIEHES